ncbi:Water stress and hypersensitive response domain-containing protein [Dyadobacter luteus]|uniref:Water stress and hypersensitive response domain-containing protein n=2 Tax=Dyadobacter luteus TaxID=2259619 RepID=A0A3D8Y6N8_9BACT|nr:Water stress and hypersensitive response domain-containing protein [Dyadobacter luteus]
MSMQRPVKITLIIVLILVLVAGGWYFFKVYKGENENPVSGLKPKVELGIGQVSNITDSTVDVKLNLLIHNPLPVGFDLDGFDYFVTMNDKKIVENNYEKPLALKARDSSAIELPAQLKIKNISEIGDAATERGEDSANYHFETVFHLKKPLLGKDSITLSVDKRLPLWQLPKVEVAGYDVEKFRLSKSEIVLQLKFTNRNSFPIQFKNPSYVIDLGKQKRLAEGSVKGFTKVKGKSSEIYEIPLAIDMGKILKAAGQIIVNGKDIPFTLYFKSVLVSENDIFKDSDVNVVVNGELKDMATVQKNLGN